MGGWRHQSHVQCVCAWMAGWVWAWIRPRLVEFIACNLHNSISVGSSEMLVAKKEEGWPSWAPRDNVAHLGTVCGAAKEPDRVQ